MEIGTSSTLFTCSLADPSAWISAFERVNAVQLNLKESAFRDAIAANPELVIAPCRAAGLVEEDELWIHWKTEQTVPSIGSIDVLLVSSWGRLGIVETKLSYNPEKRREVVAQIAEYALKIQELRRSALPQALEVDGWPAKEDLDEALSRGDFLLIVAGDELDPRAIRLGENLLAKSITAEWSLAMVDLSLYRRIGGSTGEVIVVPELRGLVRSEVRQVVRVEVKGETPQAKLVIEQVERGSTDEARGRTKLTEEQFFAAVEKNAGRESADVARRLMKELVDRGVGPVWGSASVSMRLPDPSGEHGEFTVLLIDARGKVWLGWLDRVDRAGYGPKIAAEYLDGFCLLTGARTDQPRTGIVAPYPHLKSIDPRRAELLKLVDGFVAGIRQAAAVGGGGA